MTSYAVWVLSDAYAKVAALGDWLRLRYRVALNAMTGAFVDLMANDAKIPDCDLMNRLLIVRDGVVVWGGLLMADGWTVAETAPTGDRYVLDALDHCCYLAWRTIIRPVGSDFDTRTGAADDVAKAYVNAHAGPGAAAARQFADLTIQADAAACAAVTKVWVGGTLLEHLTRLGGEKAFYWRMTPSSAGVQFQTAYPLWGLDRTKGNGVNTEIVFAFDRHNVKRMSYRHDLTAHRNYIYTGGAGEGKDQLMSERSTAGDIVSYKRRELWNPATNYTTLAGCNDEGDRALAELTPSEMMQMTPATAALTPANLGDKVTIFERRYGRTFEYDAVITAIDFEIGADGIEVVTPELTAA